MSRPTISIMTTIQWMQPMKNYFRPPSLSLIREFCFLGFYTHRQLSFCNQPTTFLTVCVCLRLRFLSSIAIFWVWLVMWFFLPSTSFIGSLAQSVVAKWNWIVVETFFPSHKQRGRSWERRRNVGSFWRPTASKSRQTGTHGAWKHCRQHRLPQG